MTSRQEQAMARREQIYNIAIQLFCEKGFENVTIQDIRKAAEISVGGFYHYFKSKTDILDEGFRIFDASTEKHFNENHPDSPIGCIYFLVNDQANSITALGYMAFAQFMKDQMNQEEKYIINTDRFFYRKMLECVSLSVDNETLYGDPTIITEEILGVTRGLIYDWCLHKGNYSLLERSTKVTKMILNAYKKENA